MTRKATIAKLLVLSVAAASAVSAYAQSARQCDVCPIEQTSPAPAQPAVVDATYRECDVCSTQGERERAQVRLAKRTTEND